MPIATEQMKWRKHRNRSQNISETNQIPNPKISSRIQPTSCKTTISSLLLSTFSNNNNTKETTHKKKKKNTKISNFSATTFSGFGCKASASKHVSVPAMIRSSADLEDNNNNNKKKKKKKKSRKNKHRRNSDKNSNNDSSTTSVTCVDFQYVWCGPGIGFSVDTAVAASSVDCAVAMKNVSARRNLDVEKIITHREHLSYLRRNTVNTESISILDEYSDIFTPLPGLESFATSRSYPHLLHPSSHGLDKIMILQGRLLMEEQLNSHDQFRDWRLDVDNMSYEQLLELGEKIGYVNTGLEEDEMRLNIRKLKLVISNVTSKNQIDKKCTICQEEYEGGEELGKLNCEHKYHFQCIKQWLVHKNFCPICKHEVVVRQMQKS
ncbi:putative aminoacyltransferase, E1 ubiquitin-activating enzyme [Lupinus albus]|uniref:RING-type E3 ubiquitin transferase n=1 Tax=Lupinus albus TaxID=3870 RepID=A0A6A4MQT9_LUPAL|nr:putative aminoacyltransferase, E1 ubiquitin-activating enzyme [Lupinus albus]